MIGGMTALSITTSKVEELVDITSDIRDVLPSLSSGGDGAVLLYCPHTTAGLFVNEGADPDVAADLAAALARLVPRDGRYRHAEGNAAAHIRSVLVGSSLTVPVTGGRMALGTWQRVFFAEFDGPRRRQVYVQFLASNSSPRLENRR